MLLCKETSVTGETTTTSVECCYLTLSRKRHPTSPDVYLLLSATLKPLMKEITFDGVNFSSDLTWSYHTNTICNKSRKLVGLLYRNFYKFSIPLTLSKLLIRPHMEYASPVWDPFLAKDIKAIEDVRKFALGVCTKSCMALWLQWATWLLRPTYTMPESFYNWLIFSSSGPAPTFFNWIEPSVEDFRVYPH